METQLLVKDKRWNSVGEPNYVLNMIDSVFTDVYIHLYGKDEFTKLYETNDKYVFSVLLTNDKEIQELNKTYRGVDKSTNVLSFPMNPDSIKPSHKKGKPYDYDRLKNDYAGNRRMMSLIIFNQICSDVEICNMVFKQISMLLFIVFEQKGFKRFGSSLDNIDWDEFYAYLRTSEGCQLYKQCYDEIIDGIIYSIIAGKRKGESVHKNVNSVQDVVHNFMSEDSMPDLLAPIFLWFGTVCKLFDVKLFAVCNDDITEDEFKGKIIQYLKTEEGRVFFKQCLGDFQEPIYNLLVEDYSDYCCCNDDECHCQDDACDCHCSCNHMDDEDWDDEDLDDDDWNDDWNEDLDDDDWDDDDWTDEDLYDDDSRHLEFDDLALGEKVVGCMAFSYDTIDKEAKEQGKAFDDHLAHLVVHSILHILGYDHETEEDANKMEDIEIAILEEMHIRNPYE